MKIAELITESQATDEGVLGSIARGAGTTLGAVGKGLGAISGAFKGAKDQYQKGQAAGRAHVGGWKQPTPKDTSVRDQEFARLTGKGAAPAAAGGAPAGGGQDLAAQIKAKEAELADLKAQQKAAGAQQAPAAQEPTPLAPPPKTEPGIGQAVNSNNAASTNTAPSPAKEPAANSLAPTDPVGNAVPGAGTNPNPTATAQEPAPAAQEPAPTGQPNLQVQQGGKNPALDARRAALEKSKADTAAGKGVTGAMQNIKKTATNEDVEFYSNFLGRML
jgi:hypothetical protein